MEEESKREKTVGEARTQFRVVLDAEANKELEQFTSKVNLGIQGQAVSKSEVANFFFKNFERLVDEKEIRGIRNYYFDEKAGLSELLKSEIALPEDLKKAIRGHFGIEGSQTRASRIKFQNSEKE